MTHKTAVPNSSMITSTPAASPLGKKVAYVDLYTPQLLFKIPRLSKRHEIGINPNDLPFKGVDVWNAFELSWLNLKGKPMTALGQFDFPCESPNLIESKSFKLYLNSFNQTNFSTKESVEEILRRDLSEAANATIQVKIATLDEIPALKIDRFTSHCLDNIDTQCSVYTPQPGFLKTEKGPRVEESLHSNLLKSNCLVTGQPDWGSVEISYSGKKIDHEGLLKYIISFRNHLEFHEQCVERIFVDIMSRCNPEKLTVHARYTRRGGLDINPIRTTERDLKIDNIRLFRQ